MTAWPPTTRYLIPESLKSLNRSLKSEFIRRTRATGVGVDDHLPCGFEDGGRTLTLPIGYVEGAVEFGEPAVALHDERVFAAGIGRLVQESALVVIVRLGLVERLRGVEGAEVVGGGAGFGVVGAEGIGEDAEGAFKMRAGGGQVAEVSEDQAEIVGGCGDSDVVWSVCVLVKQECALGQGAGGGQVPKILKYRGKIIGVAGDVWVIGPEDLLIDSQSPLDEGPGGRQVAKFSENPAEVAGVGRDFGMF